LFNVLILALYYYALYCLSFMINYTEESTTPRK